MAEPARQGSMLSWRGFRGCPIRGRLPCTAVLERDDLVARGTTVKSASGVHFTMVTWFGAAGSSGTSAGGSVVAVTPDIRIVTELPFLLAL